MSKTNLQKKSEIDDIVVKYKIKFAGLKKRRDKIIVDFVEALRQKRLQEIKKSLK